MYWLGIDIGTGGSRALLVDEKRHGEGAATRPPRRYADGAAALGGAAARELVGRRAARGSRRAAASRRDRALTCRASGLSGQMHGLTLLDEADEVIRPALIWCDQRSQAQVDCVNAKVGTREGPGVHRQSGGDGLHAAEAAVGSRQRAAQFRPRPQGASSQGLRAFQSDRRVRQRGVGRVRHVAVRRREAALVVSRCATRCGLDRSILPAVYESSEVSGKITAAVAAVAGPWPPARLSWAAAATRPRARWATASWKRESSRARSGRRAWCSRTWTSRTTIRRGASIRSATRFRNKWHVMGVTQGAGLSLQWFRNQLAPGAEYDGADEGSGDSAARVAGPVLAAVPDGRAHAAPRRHGARGVGRSDGEPHASGPGPVRHRRRLLQPEGRARHHRRDGRAGRVGATVRRRRAQPVLAAD